MSTFVWVKGMRGPTPQIWGDDYNPLDLQKQAKAVVLQKHDIGNATNMTLDALAVVYPLEKSNEV